MLAVLWLVLLGSVCGVNAIHGVAAGAGAAGAGAGAGAVRGVIAAGCW